MLRACVHDLQGKWEEHLPLVEFSYNNSYQSTSKWPFLKHVMGEDVGHLYAGVS